ncbi:MAG: helix-turn-helix domain-containing protein [Chlamydiia bacterium]|nr:helix-turn-helix domain-containing protein [Simkania sp.]MCB1073615.1 helix-turn-helix domain-containing protein [Chlamydiia bacterium]
MPSPEIIENAIYSAEELSELFDIPYQNMRLLIKRGHVKGKKIGKNWFVTGKSLLRVFEENDEDNDEIEGDEEIFNNDNTED